jgi:hypothetical protein
MPFSCVIPQTETEKSAQNQSLMKQVRCSLFSMFSLCSSCSMCSRYRVKGKGPPYLRVVACGVFLGDTALRHYLGLCAVSAVEAGPSSESLKRNHSLNISAIQGYRRARLTHNPGPANRINSAARVGKSRCRRFDKSRFRLPMSRHLKGPRIRRLAASLVLIYQ